MASAPKISSILLAVVLTGCAATPKEEHPFYAYGKAPGENPELNRITGGEYEIVNLGALHGSIARSPSFHGLTSFPGYYGHYYGYPGYIPYYRPPVVVDDPGEGEDSTGPDTQTAMPPGRDYLAPPTTNLPEPRRPVRPAPPPRPATQPVRNKPMHRVQNRRPPTVSKPRVRANQAARMPKPVYRAPKPQKRQLPR